MVEKNRVRPEDDGSIDVSNVHKRVFECRTCNKQFASFQALGGHRAGHKKPRLSQDEQGQKQSAVGKPKGHECSVCGLEFAIGQALGGHMRRHRATNQGFGRGLTEKKSSGKRVLLLDLNLPASGADIDSLELGLGLGLGTEYVNKIPMMTCFF